MKNNNGYEFLIVAGMISAFFIITQMMVKSLGCAMSLIIFIGLIIIGAYKLKGGDK